MRQTRFPFGRVMPTFRYRPCDTGVFALHLKEKPAFQVVGEGRPSRFLITCDHATNRVPEWVGGGDLGIAPQDMGRHIAYDVGAAGTTLALAEALDAPAILSDFSRLVIDPNRGTDDPTLLMKLYDGTIIPANRRADVAETEKRIAQLYRPYHDACARLAARQADTVIVAVHSFTPCLKGRPPRPWQVGVLYSHLDDRFSKSFLAELMVEPDLCVGENEPYSGHLPGDSIEKHALNYGRHNTLIELRSDLIETPQGQQDWAARLAPLLVAALRNMPKQGD